MLRAEGFTDVKYLEFRRRASRLRAPGSGDLDISQGFIAPSIVQIDRGTPLLLLAGVHVGCFELFRQRSYPRHPRPRGKTVGNTCVRIESPRVPTAMLAYVGLDAGGRQLHRTAARQKRSGSWPKARSTAHMGFPPDPQELRAKKVGHVVVNSVVDGPGPSTSVAWCREPRVVQKQSRLPPKRAIRAILKADQICATQPERAARTLVERDSRRTYDYALQAMKDVPYGHWQDFDAEDAVPLLWRYASKKPGYQVEPAEDYRAGTGLAS